MRLLSILVFAFACKGSIDDSANGGDNGDDGGFGGGDDGGDDQDADGDGYDKDNDCNDDEASIHPGATEICDGVDQDCDENIDDGLETGRYYPDDDGDGYGMDVPVTDTAFFRDADEGCSPPSGFTIGGEDCNDADPTINPDATEVCDEKNIDENCNGVADDKDGTTDEKTKSYFYPDHDLDGYGGNDYTPGYFCDPTTAYPASVKGDCNDEDGFISPSTEEFCSDGVDNDCNGTTDICEVEGEYSLENPEARKLVGEGAANMLGSAIAGVGDTNGDDIEDILVAERPMATPVSLVLGPITGRDGLSTFTTATFGTTSGDAGAGSSLGRAGDLNADGFDEVLIGAPLDDDGGADAGAFWVVPGPMSGPVTLDDSWKLTGASSGDLGGTALTGGPDINGDSLDDIVEGSPGADSGAGAVHLVYGPVTAGGSLGGISDVTFEGESGQAFGSSVSIADDLDGDGSYDIVVGAPGAGSGAGALYVFHGPFSPGTILASAADGTPAGESGDAAGTSVSAPGDVDGDGLTDVVVGAPGHDGSGTDRGVAYLVLGPASDSGTLAAAAEGHVDGGYDDAGLGCSVAGADFDKDGNTDALIGALWAGKKPESEAYLFDGPFTGALVGSDADLRITAEVGSDRVGVTVATVDHNADGYGDLLIGAPGESTNGPSAGSVYLVVGR